jgi:hypothetical protein
MNDIRVLAALLAVAQAIVYHRDSRYQPTRQSDEIVTLWYNNWIQKFEEQPINTNVL